VIGAVVAAVVVAGAVAAVQSGGNPLSSDESDAPETTQDAADAFFPGYARAVTDVGKERGWPPVTRAGFDAQRGPEGALLIGSPDEVVEKIHRHSEALGGISRITFQMNVASLPHASLMRAIELIGTTVAPALHEELANIPSE